MNLASVHFFPGILDPIVSVLRNFSSYSNSFTQLLPFIASWWRERAEGIDSTHNRKRRQGKSETWLPTQGWRDSRFSSHFFSAFTLLVVFVSPSATHDAKKFTRLLLPSYSELPQFASQPETSCMNNPGPDLFPFLPALVLHSFTSKLCRKRKSSGAGWLWKAEV